jgi:hypothetical protein
MKKRIHLQLLFLILFTFSIGPLSADPTSDWQSIYLTPGGGNTMDGVEAYFLLGTCNGEDVVYVKFINHNDYPVKLEWYDAVFNQELKWINKDEEQNKRSVLISSKTEVKGECAMKNYPELIIKVKDFVADKKEFKRYSSYRLNVLAVQQ